MTYALKFLTPEVVASAVIGKGGAVIAAMRQSCQAKIGLTDHNDFYPGTDCRVLTAQANAEESLYEVARQIIAKITECAQATPSESLGQPGELKLRTLMPRAAVGGVIGKGGATVKALREQTGAKISISEAIGSGPHAEQVVAITGSQQALEYVMMEVNKQVQALFKEAWFQSWVTGGSASAPAPMSRNGGQGYAPPSLSHHGSHHGSSGGVGSAVGYAAAAGPGQGVELMGRVAQNLPQYVMDDARGFAMSCVVPNRLVGGLIGRGGSGTKEVQGITGTKIGIREIPGDPENRSMNIAGPLSNTCAAYMLMMKRYLDAEAQAQATQE